MACTPYAERIACDHAGRPVFSRGACHECYNAWYYEAKNCFVDVQTDWPAEARRVADLVAATSPRLLSHLTAELVRRAIA